MTQLMLEYNLQPPFNAGIPETAGKSIVNPLMPYRKPFVEAFLGQTREILQQEN